MRLLSRSRGREIRRLFAVAAAGLAAACGPPTGVPRQPAASPPTSVTRAGTDVIVNVNQEPAAFSARLPEPPERAWPALYDVYGELGIPVETVDEPGRTLGNLRYSVVRRLAGRPLSAFLDCGRSASGGTISDEYRVQLSVRTTLTPAPGGSEVRTLVQATARSVEGAGAAAVPCASTGVLEQRISVLLAARLGARGQSLTLSDVILRPGRAEYRNAQVTAGPKDLAGERQVGGCGSPRLPGPAKLSERRDHRRTTRSPPGGAMERSRLRLAKSARRSG